MQQTISVKRLDDEAFPAALRQIAGPPSQLYVCGQALGDSMIRPRLAIVGSRKVSAYGKAVTAKLAMELARLGIVIVSGLAFGVDAVAHRAALEAGGTTWAVLACSVERVYPASHQQLANAIVRQGGAILSEYPPGSVSYKQNFIARNRLVSGLSDGVLITEAALKSGSLHTARFALEQGREVLAVPGNITSETSVGTNNLIKSGAVPVTCAEDVLHVFGWERLMQSPKPFLPHGSTAEEKAIISLIAAGLSDGSDLLVQSQLPINLFNQTLTMLEITGKLRALGNNQWALQ